MRPGSAGSGLTGKGHDRITLLGCLGGGEYRTQETSPEISDWPGGSSSSPLVGSKCGQDVEVPTSRVRPTYMSYEAAEDIPYIQKPNFMEVRTRGLAVINSDRFVATGWGYSTFEGKRDRRTN